MKTFMRMVLSLGAAGLGVLTAVAQPPEGKHWIHELKHDGYRSMVLVERGRVRVYTRNGFDWSDRYLAWPTAFPSDSLKSSAL